MEGRVRINLTGAVDDGVLNAWDATWLNGKIYILTDHAVLVYSDQAPTKLMETRAIQGQGRLVDIVASPETNCLYVTDQSSSVAMKESCIWKINLENTEEASKWIKQSTGMFISSSLTADGRIIVSVQAKVNRLQICNPLDDSQENVPLSDIKFINHAIEIADETYAVAYGKSHIGNTGLCIVKGPNPYTVSRVVTGEVLNRPWYLAVYENCDVLLADSKNDRILILNSDMRCRRELLTKRRDEIVEPRRMCYVTERNLLIVVHRGGNGFRVVDLFYENYWN